MNYVYLFWVKVIGDKQAGKTSEFLSTAIDILKEIMQTLQVPLRFIHIVRNPFDNIATMTLRETGTREAVIEEGMQVRNVVDILTLNLVTFIWRHIEVNWVPNPHKRHGAQNFLFFFSFLFFSSNR